MVGLYYSASILAGRASAPYVLPPCMYTSVLWYQAYILYVGFQLQGALVTHRQYNTPINMLVCIEIYVLLSSLFSCLPSC